MQKTKQKDHRPVSEQNNDPVQAQYVDDNYDDLIALWCLRILVRLGGHKRFYCGSGRYSSDEVLYAIGLGHLEDEETSKATARKLFKDRLQALENAKPKLQGALSNNLAWLERQLSFSRVESDILGFSILLHTTRALDDCTDTLGDISRTKLIQALSVVLGHPRKRVCEALHARGKLASSGLLRLDSTYTRSMQGKIDLMDSLCDAMLSEHTNPMDMFDSFFRNSLSPRLEKGDFSHIRKDYDLLYQYLSSSLKEKTIGVNFLIHGPPGTGKTELVRTLANEVGTRLYEINMEDAQGNPMAGKERFSAYQLSQKILTGKTEAIILLDEIEDVFPGRRFFFGGFDSDSESQKAWVNRLLETNPIPAFWLSNEIRQIDSAYLRRFDYVLELGAPSRRVRKRILSMYLNNIPVSDSWQEQTSRNDHLLPAHIERAAKVVSHLTRKDKKTNEQLLDQTLQSTLDAMGLPRKPAHALTMVTKYNPGILNPDHDLTNLIYGLRKTPKGRICMYGSPGTGKTAFAHYIAEVLDIPLIVKRASDILSMWVGGTEKSIAAMFRQAEQEDAMLLLDEADSFLQDRSGAQHSWEITQVNELLTQMEAFEGLFICSTNLMENLDEASLRRFDLKIHFDYLMPEQAWELFRQEVGEHIFENKQSHIQAALQKLGNLTPGDFATVKRQQKFFGSSLSPLSFLDALEKECQAKRKVSSRPIGFLN